MQNRNANNFHHLYLVFSDIPILWCYTRDIRWRGQEGWGRRRGLLGKFTRNICLEYSSIGDPCYPLKRMLNWLIVLMSCIIYVKLLVCEFSGLYVQEKLSNFDVKVDNYLWAHFIAISSAGKVVHQASHVVSSKPEVAYRSSPDKMF